MRDSASQEEIDFYRENGFVRIRALLDREEVERLIQLQDDAIAQRGNYRLPPQDRMIEERPSHDLLFLQRLNLWKDFPPMREFSLNENIGKIACDLAGVEGVRLWHDSCFQKQGWGNPTWWHFDAAYWAFDAPEGLSVWISLNGTGASDGGLHFMPGSHREISPEKISFAQDRVAGLFDLPNYQQWKNRESVCLPLEPGDCTFHNGRTLHGSGANMTPRIRNAWACAYMPDGSCYNGTPNVLPTDYVNSLKIGDPLDNEAVNPLIYSR